MRLPTPTEPAPAPAPVFDILVARKIALAIRCDPRTVMREWQNPGAVRGTIGILIRRELAPLRARIRSNNASRPSACAR